MKARELAAWLLERPDLEVLVADPGDGWDPVYTEPEPEETQGVAYFNVNQPSGGNPVGAGDRRRQLTACQGA